MSLHQSDCLPHPSPDAVRRQLDRILRSAIFQRAPALSRLLKHVVERTLQDGGQELKEYSLGIDVFGRGDSFDPTTDTIVRVQARRLRGKLDEYYRVHTGDRVRIEIPTGRYAPLFRTLPSHDSGGPSSTDVARGFGVTVPAPRTPLIGRERELQALTRLLETAPVRLVTVTGAGGSGKTRLAIEAARHVADRCDGGVLMVSLAPFADPGMLPAALAQLLGLRETGGRPLPEALCALVRHVVTTPTLLVADNFEHLIAAAPFIGDLLEASAHLRVLVTSRTVLRIYGEQEFPLDPLPVPDRWDDLAALRRSPAIRLFVDRAGLVNPAYRLTGDQAAAVAGICRRLDGLPLAIELAAARMKLFTPDVILRQLERSLDVLTDGPRDVPPRHQTLRETIGWSHALLTVAERRLFRRLAVFAGGCTLEGVEAVCNAYHDLGIEPTAGMQALADMSMVGRTSDGPDTRFRMLETIRAYAVEQLACCGDEDATRRAHAAYCIVLAEEGSAALSAPARDAWLARCDAERDNFRTALDWLVSSGNPSWALRLGVALFGYWEQRELLGEARGRLEAITTLARRDPPAAAWARAVSYTAAVCDLQGDHDRGRTLHEEALAAFRRLGDRRGETAQLNALGANRRFVGDYEDALAYWEQTLASCRELGDEAELAAAISNLAGVVSHLGDAPRARALLEEARSIFERLGDCVAVLWTVNRMGDTARRAGDLREARRLYEASLDGFTRCGDPWGVARTSSDLAHVHVELGDPPAAYTRFVEALKIFAAMDHRRGIASVLEGMAILAQREGQPGRALRLAGAADGIRLARGAVPRQEERAVLEQRLAPSWNARPGNEAREAWEGGRRLSLEESIGLALSSPPDAVPKPGARQDS